MDMDTDNFNGQLRKKLDRWKEKVWFKKIPENLILKGLGHEIRIQFKWYGLIGLGLEKFQQIFITFLTVPLILNWINKFLTV